MDQNTPGTTPPTAESPTSISPASASARRRKGNPLALILGLSLAFFVLFLIVSGALYLRKSPGGASSGSKAGLFGEGSVGVVELNGVIMDSRKTLKQLERFEE